MGHANIWIPRTDKGKEMRVGGLSDAVAMSYGRLFAMTLSEQDGFVVVTLQCGSVRIIGYDTILGRIVTGHLVYRTHQDFVDDCFGE